MEDSVHTELDDVKAELEKLRAECRVKTQQIECFKNDRAEKFQEIANLAEKRARELDVKAEEIYELTRINEDIESSLREKEKCIVHLSLENNKIQEIANLAEKRANELDLKLEEIYELKRIKEDLESSLREKEKCIVHLSSENKKIQEIVNLAEKRAHELDVKAEEIYELTRIKEDLESSLREKEKCIVHLSSENNKIQVGFAEKVVKLEGSNSELVLALDELSSRNSYLEQNVAASSEEINGLKSLLLAAEKKYIAAEERVKQANTLRMREDVIMQLEEQNMTVQDKIKWRNEQFKHLEEAYEKLKVQFGLSKEEWEKERSLLVGEISSLQISLDSKTRTLEEVQSRFEMCNHALAREESKRKLLEAEISEFKTCFDDVYGQCEEKKSEIQQLTIMRNDEIAELRNSLGEKETLVKELERKIVLLEQDNQELGDLLKEFREAQIRDAGGNSLTSKLRNKLRKLEEVHKNCSSILKSKESQWDDQRAKMETDVIGYKSALINKEQEIKELQMELEKCYYCNEESDIGLLIFKTVLAEAYSNSFGTETGKADCGKENESLKNLEQKQFLLEQELEQQKKFLEESSADKLILKEQFLQMENTLKHERKTASEALDMLKHEMASKSDELSRLDCEAQNWKSTAENLKVSYEAMETSLLSQIENEKTLKQEHKNLLCIVKDQERETEDLQLQIALLESCNAEKTKIAERCKHKKDELVQTVMEKDCCIKGLQKDIAVACLKQESLKKELEDAVLAQLAARKALEQKEDFLWKIKDEKDQTIKHCQKLAKASEQDLFDAMYFFFSKEVENLVEVCMLTEALKNAEHWTKLEIEDLHLQIHLLESCNAEKTKIAERCKQEKDELVQTVMEKDCCIKGLQKDIAVACRKQESVKKELEDAALAQLAARKALEEKEGLLWKIKDEKDQTIKHFQKLAKASEQDFFDALYYCFSQEVENLVEVCMLTEALKNAEHWTKLEIEDLHLQIHLLESCNAEKTKIAERCKQEKDELVQTVMEKDCCIKGLQKDIAVACLKQESVKKELEDAVLAQLAAQKALEQKEDLLWKIKEEKDQTINHYQKLAKTSEQDLFDALYFCFSKEVENLVEVCMLTEALKNAEHRTKLEIEEKNTRIMKSELEINNLLENLAQTEESRSHLKHEAKQFQISLEAMELETNILNDEKQKMRQIIAGMKFEKEYLLQDIAKLSTEREEMLAQIEYIYDKVGDLSSEDMQLMDKLEYMLNTSRADENEIAMDSEVRDNDKLHGSVQDSANGLVFPPTNKNSEENFDGRLPLREVNSLHV